MKKFLLIMILALSLFLASCSKKSNTDNVDNNGPSHVEPSNDSDDSTGNDDKDDSDDKIKNGGAYDEGGNDTWIPL